LNAIGTYLFSQSGTLIVSQYHGASVTGNYQLAAQLFGVLGILPTAVTQILYGVVAKEGPDGGWITNRSVLHRSLIGVTVLILIAWFASPLLIDLIAGPKFSEAAGYFRAMLPILVAGTVSAAMAPQWIGRGYFWRASLITMFIGLIGFSISLYLTPRMGAYGAIVGTGVAYGSGLFFNLALYMYCNRVHVNKIR
jgi:O-antigen/teichoic acid export membrane protein